MPYSYLTQFGQYHKLDTISINLDILLNIVLNMLIIRYVVHKNYHS